MRFSILMAALLIGACGADGPPERPGVTPTVEVSATVEAGVTGSF